MKNLLYGTLFLALVGIAFVGCEKSENDTNDTKRVRANDSQKQDLFPFDFPEKTKLKLEGNTLYFDLPEGYSIVGITKDKTFFQSVSGASGTITCTCLKESGGCSPAKSGDTYACVMTTCSSCEKSTSISGSRYQFSELIIINPDGQGPYAKAYNLHKKIVLPKEFINYDLFYNTIKKLRDGFSNPNEKKRKIVFYELYGYVIPLDIPFSEDTYSAFILNDRNSSGIDCNCNTQGGNCPKEVIPFTAVYCDASNCKSCTMSATIRSPQTDDVNRIEIFNNRISIK